LILRKEGWSFPEIGLEFGKDHSTVQYGLEKQAQLEADK
jgi:chromosomal replication initiation ATPase DnaA